MKKKLGKLRSMNPEELKKRLNELRIETGKVKAMIEIGQPLSSQDKKTSYYGTYVNGRKEIARIETILNERREKE